MYYDLNVPWTANTKELQSRLSFLAERTYPPIRARPLIESLVGYNVVAISHTLRPAATDLVPTSRTKALNPAKSKRRPTPSPRHCHSRPRMASGAC
jgi:hypothetical protein